MPLQREHVQFAVIVMCVPLQMFLSGYMGSTETSRTHAISQVVSQFKEMRDSWLRLDSWRNWCSRVLRLKLQDIFDPYGLDDPNGECPAKEVFMFRDKDGYFGQSIEPRDTRPPHVTFRVGQVIKHKRWGYRGVIIGWDLRARAPDQWLREMHKKEPEWRNQPNYAVLVDTRDRPAPQITYVPQENIESLKHTKILHPSVEDYFEQFDGSQYLPRPWLRTIYRRD